jgi:hypothetical protein
MKKCQYETEQTLTKEEFSTGARRNDATGKGKYVLITPFGMKRIAGVYERGALAHGLRNWEQGIPISRLLDSAIRHIYQYIEGCKKEDHLAQGAWNLFAAMHMEEMIDRKLLPESLYDMPQYEREECTCNDQSGENKCCNCDDECNCNNEEIKEFE